MSKMELPTTKFATGRTMGLYLGYEFLTRIKLKTDSNTALNKT